MNELGTIRSYDDLLTAFRARVVELGTNYEALAVVMGVTETFPTKLLAPSRIRTLTPMTFDALLGALALELVPRENAKALAKVRDRLAKRELAPSMLTADKHRPIIVRVSRHRMKKLAKKAAEARKHIPKRKRRSIARKAALARWHPPIVEAVVAPAEHPPAPAALPSAPAQP